MYTLANKLSIVNEASRDLDSLGMGAIDVDSMHKKLIENYSGNPVISDAIGGRKTVGESLLELGEYNHGLEQFFPRGRDEEFNQERNNLKALIEPVPTNKGFYASDNFVAGAIYSGVITFGLLNFIQNIIVLLGDPPIDSFPAISGVISAAVAVCWGIKSQSTRRVSSKAIDEARYIDKRIRELGLRK